MAIIVAIIFGMMHLVAGIAFAVDLKLRARQLATLQTKQFGFRVLPGGEWVWSFSQHPLEEEVGHLSGPAIDIVRILGLPWVRVRSAIPEELFDGSLAEATGRKRGLDGQAIRETAVLSARLIRQVYEGAKSAAVTATAGKRGKAADSRLTSADGSFIEEGEEEEGWGDERSEYSSVTANTATTVPSRPVRAKGRQLPKGPAGMGKANGKANGVKVNGGKANGGKANGGKQSAAPSESQLSSTSSSDSDSSSESSAWEATSQGTSAMDTQSETSDAKRKRAAKGKAKATSEDGGASAPVGADVTENSGTRPSLNVGTDSEAGSEASSRLPGRGLPKKPAAGKAPGKKTPAKVNGTRRSGNARSEASSDVTGTERTGDEEAPFDDYSDYSDDSDYEKDGGLGAIAEGDEGDYDGMVDEDGINQEKICCARPTLRLENSWRGRRANVQGVAFTRCHPPGTCERLPPRLTPPPKPNLRRHCAHLRVRLHREACPRG